MQLEARGWAERKVFMGAKSPSLRAPALYVFTFLTDGKRELCITNLKNLTFLSLLRRSNILFLKS